MAINSSVSGYNPNPAKQPTDLRVIFTVVGWVWLGSWEQLQVFTK